MSEVLRSASTDTEAAGGPAGGPAGGSEVELTPMRRRHLRSVLRIEGQQQSPGWSLGLFMAELARADDRCYLVARASGSVVGFGGLLYVGDEAHLTTLAVHSAHLRRQVGSRLLLALCRDALGRGTVTAMTLEVRAGNLAAQGLYRRFGFAPVGVRRAYYRDPEEDALVMWAHDVDQPAHLDRLARIAGELPPVRVTGGVAW